MAVPHTFASRLAHALLNMKASQRTAVTSAFQAAYNSLVAHQTIYFPADARLRRHVAWIENELVDFARDLAVELT